jgi:hypothetical protein
MQRGHSQTHSFETYRARYWGQPIHLPRLRTSSMQPITRHMRPENVAHLRLASSQSDCRALRPSLHPVQRLPDQETRNALARMNKPAE